MINKDETCKAILIASIFVNFWPLVPSGNFFNNWLSMINFYPIGFYLYFKHKTEKKLNDHFTRNLIILKILRKWKI